MIETVCPLKSSVKFRTVKGCSIPPATGLAAPGSVEPSCARASPACGRIAGVCASLLVSGNLSEFKEVDIVIHPPYRTELRLYTARAHRYPTRVRPAHQAMARTALLPIGVPSNSPRSVSMTGVKGWYSANQRTPTGIESGLTNALLVNGSRSWKMRERLLAPAGVLPTRPNTTPIHVSAKVNNATTPSALIQATGPVVG